MATTERDNLGNRWRILNDDGSYAASVEAQIYGGDRASRVMVAIAGTPGLMTTVAPDVAQALGVALIAAADRAQQS